MKKIISLFLISYSSVFAAYINMANQSSNASSLNMTLNNYAQSMSYAGLFSGAIFGLFIWKIK